MVSDAAVVPHDLDEDDQTRAAIGLLVLDGDSTIEYEMRGFLALPHIRAYVSRLYAPTEMTLDALEEMAGGIAGATRLIVPGQRLDVVAFACTCAPVQLGEETVFDRIREVRPEVHCTTPVTAALAALTALDARRIAMISPYPADINQMMREFLESKGLSVTRIARFDESNVNNAGRISLASIGRAAIALGSDESVDAVFVSCTSLRIREIIEELENSLDKPIISSNQTLAWHCLRLAGVDDHLPRFGRLGQQSVESSSANIDKVN